MILNNHFHHYLKIVATEHYYLQELDWIDSYDERHSIFQLEYKYYLIKTYKK